MDQELLMKQIVEQVMAAMKNGTPASAPGRRFQLRLQGHRGQLSSGREHGRPDQDPHRQGLHLSEL